MKARGLSPIVRFKTISKPKEYNRISKKCLLCLKEKLELTKVLNNPDNFNKKSELMGHCRHRSKYLLSSINTLGFKPNLDMGWFGDRGRQPENEVLEENNKILSPLGSSEGSGNHIEPLQHENQPDGLDDQINGSSRRLRSRIIWNTT